MMRTSSAQIRCEDCGERHRLSKFPGYPELPICLWCLGECKSCRYVIPPDLPTEKLSRPQGFCRRCTDSTSSQRFRFERNRRGQQSPVHYSLAQMQNRGRKFYYHSSPIWTTKQCREVLQYCLTDSISFPWQPINFGPPQTHRHQRTIWMIDCAVTDIETHRLFLPTCLQEFIKHITGALPETRFITVKVLWSSTETTQCQNYHADDPKLSEYSDYHYVHYGNASYSFLFALETARVKNPTHIVDGNTEFVYRIAPGAFIAMRGDYIHAGAAYGHSNYRLFIATGTEQFKNEGTDVGEVVDL